MKSVLLCAISWLLLSSCMVNVHTAYDHHVDFKKYKTFCWLKGCAFTFTGPYYMNELIVQQQLQQAIVAAMKKKKLEYSDGAPDLLMDVHVVIKTDTAVIYHEQEPFLINVLGPDKVVVLHGSLVLDLVDQKSGRMVWRSVALSYMDDHPELTASNFRRVIRRSLRRFPAAMTFSTATGL